MLTRVTITLRSQGRPDAELIRPILLNLGIPDRDIVEETRQQKSSVGFYATTFRSAGLFRKRFRSLKITGASVSLSRVRDRDWKTRWKKYFKPFNITPDLRLVPRSFKGKDAERSGRTILIDTTVAFGSGLHATTQLMAKLIRMHKGAIRTFLDVGTCSGVLSIIAHAYGARDIWALDIDKEAVKTARRNFRLNGCKPKYLKTADIRHFRPAPQFGFVCANLITEDLITFKKRLVAAVAPGGLLAVSGIYRQNYPSFRARFKDKRLSCIEVIKKKSWYALLFRKK